LCGHVLTRRARTSEGVTHEDPGEGKRYCDGYKIEKDLVVEDLDIATTFVCSPNEKDVSTTHITL